MPFFDLPLEELRKYKSTAPEPDDFDDFWSETLREAREEPAEPRVTRVDSVLRAIDVYDVVYPGFGGHPIRGWLTTPAGADGALPAVVSFRGYGGGRGLPYEKMAWAAAGYASLLMDTRGQGSAWGTGGATPDPVGSSPSAPGFMTRGITDPHSYYYRRVFVDAVLAIDAVRSMPLVNADTVAVTGASQGGGIAIAVGGLVEDLVAVMPDVPFLCDFPRAVGLTDNDPYQEIVRYLAVHRDAPDQVFRTLSYFDAVNFAKRCNAPALFSVGLMDEICPPSTVFGAVNNYAGPVSMEVYPFNEHEGGEGHHWMRLAEWLRGVIDAAKSADRHAEGLVTEPTASPPRGPS
jgi:cephalosporin-C deacetylase